MYVHAFDETNAVLLGIFTGRKGPEDLERHTEAWKRVDAVAHSQGKGALFVIFPDVGYPTPNSRDRQRFADLESACLSSPSALILVTRSALLRGILTAVSRLYPRNARWRSTACGSFDDALEHAAEYGSSARASLEAMERSLRVGLKTTARVA
jgi:hypothetical protein